MKIGKSNDSTSLNQSETLLFETRPWEILSRQVTDELANDWFEGLDFVPATIAIAEAGLQQDTPLLNMVFPFLGLPGSDGEKLGQHMFIKNLSVDESSQGEQCSPESTRIGRTVIEAMNTSGIRWNYQTQFFVNDSQQVDVSEALDLASSTGDIEAQEELKRTILTTWQTSSGQLYEQQFRVYRDSSGRETGFWSAPVFAATRSLDGIQEWDPVFADFTFTPPCEDVGKWCREIAIPILAKQLFFLAETPFPSSSAAFDRKLGWSLFEPKNRPRPTLLKAKRAQVSGVTSSNGQSVTTVGSLFPDVFEFGWRFDAETLEQAVEVLTVASNGLTAITDAVIDGFRNYLKVDYPAPFEWRTFSIGDLTLPSGEVGTADLMPKIIPAVLSGEIIESWHPSNFAALTGNDPRNAEVTLALITSDGVGPYWVNAANDYIWSFLIPQKLWPEVDRVAQFALAANVYQQSTNALSNWGISLYLRGDRDLATEKFHAALDRDDKFSDAEANWWLARIYQEMGNSSKADFHAKACEASGGYETPDFLSETTNNSVGTNVAIGKAAFCSSCGNRFTDESQNFCPSCGSKR